MDVIMLRFLRWEIILGHQSGLNVVTREEGSKGGREGEGMMEAEIAVIEGQEPRDVATSEAGTSEEMHCFRASRRNTALSTHLDF